MIFFCNRLGFTKTPLFTFGALLTISAGSRLLFKYVVTLNWNVQHFLLYFSSLANEARRVIAFAEMRKRKVRTPQGSEPDNVRAPLKEGDDKCNREYSCLL